MSSAADPKYIFKTVKYCTSCDGALTADQYINSKGTCPLCGATCTNVVCAATNRVFKYVLAGYKGWWLFRKPVYERLEEVTSATIAKSTKPSIAERCFADQSVHEQLYTILHEIVVGERPSIRNPQFPIHDVSTSDYNESVEIVLQEDASALTLKQVEKIFALGFPVVYETRGDKSYCWSIVNPTPTPTRLRVVSDESLRIASYKLRLEEAEEEIKQLKEKLSEK